MSARGRSEALIPQRDSVKGRLLSARGRSEALIPQRDSVKGRLLSLLLF